MDEREKYSPGFETEVLVTLTEIKGDLGKLVQAHDATRQQVERHEGQISALRALVPQGEQVEQLRKEVSTLRSLVMKGIGAALALAFVIPLFLQYAKGA